MWRLMGQGKNARDICYNSKTDETRVRSDVALLDFGFRKVAEEAMLKLICHLVSKSCDTRTHMLLPLDGLTELSTQLEHEVDE